MKTTLLAILLAAAAGSSNAVYLSMPGSLGLYSAGASSDPIFKAANSRAAGA